MADWDERTREDGGTLSELADDLRAYVESLPAVATVTERASRAAVNQRAGRAARQAPGVAIRLWGEAATSSLPAPAPLRQRSAKS